MGTHASSYINSLVHAPPPLPTWANMYINIPKSIHMVELHRLVEHKFKWEASVGPYAKKNCQTTAV